MLICKSFSQSVCNTRMPIDILLIGADLGFPVGGGANPPVSANIKIARFSQKLHEIKKILVGGHRGRPPPLDPSLANFVLDVALDKLAQPGSQEVPLIYINRICCHL